MSRLLLFDIPPDPARVGAPVAVVLLLILSFILVLAAGLVVFLWYRKRSLRGVEMIRPAGSSVPRPAQPNSPNQL